MIILPYIISGKVEKFVGRKSVNKKEMTKLQASSYYPLIVNKYHNEKNADLTISANAIDIKMASEYGIMEVDENMRLIDFIEKPLNKPKHIPGDESKCLASMGNYLFNSKCLIDELIIDSKIKDSQHDFGKNIIPNMLKKNYNIYIYNFSNNEYPGMLPSERGYWRDVGTVDSYWQANMDLLDYNNELKLFNKEWL